MLVCRKKLSEDRIRISGFDREKIEAHILKSLAGYKAPVYYVVYEEFPLLSNGKIDRISLKK